MMYVEYKGTPHTIKQLSELSGIAPATIRDRLRRGYPVEQAIRMVAANESVNHFAEASLWCDWVDMPMSDLHEIYFKWCVSHGEQPLGVQGFSRHLMAMHPWLKTVPIKRGNKSCRIIRKVSYEKV